MKMQPACGAKASSANKKLHQHTAGELPPPPPSPLREHEKLSNIFSSTTNAGSSKGGAKDQGGKNQQQRGDKGSSQNMAGNSGPKQHPTGNPGPENGQRRPTGSEAQGEGKGGQASMQGRGPYGPSNQRTRGKPSYLHNIWRWCVSQGNRLVASVQALFGVASGHARVMRQRFAREILITCGLILCLVMFVYVFGFWDSRVVIWKARGRREKAGTWARMTGWLIGANSQKNDGRVKSRRNLTPLPDGWIAKESRTWGKAYYVNTVTGVSVWTHPGLPPTESRAPSSTGSSGSAVNPDKSTKGGQVRNRKSRQAPISPSTPKGTPVSPAAALGQPQHPPAQKEAPSSPESCETPSSPRNSTVEKERPEETSRVEVLVDKEEVVTAKSLASDQTANKLESVDEEVNEEVNGANSEAAGSQRSKGLGPKEAVRASKNQTVDSGDSIGAEEAEVAAAAVDLKADVMLELGNRLYALIYVEHGSLAGKITGLLLQGLEHSELVALIDDQVALQSRIQEAVEALEAVQAAVKRNAAAVPVWQNGLEPAAVGSAEASTATETDGGMHMAGKKETAAQKDVVQASDSKKQVCAAAKKKVVEGAADEAGATEADEAAAPASVASSHETTSSEPLPAKKLAPVVEGSPPSASSRQDTRICHCNRSGCELCNAVKKSLQKEEDGKRSSAAAASALQVEVAGKGMPQFRKRKPRKDLDLSACDPCGYFNGNNGDSNLCFMNAALQLLLHSMRCMPDDLNRCNQAVALSLREWVEAVLECGRSYTPGSTPKYAKAPATSSPKYTVVGGSSAGSAASNVKGSGSSTDAAAKYLLLDGPPVAGASSAPTRVLRKDKSDKLRMVLSEHFNMIVRPAARQRQCDACEFLEGVLEDLRADVAGCALDNSAQKTLQDLTNFILKNMEEESLQGRGLDWSYLRNLNQLADLRWQADVLGTYEAPGSIQTESNPVKDDRNCPVSFAGQMMTSTWDQQKAAFTGCEFEPFHVWVLSLEGGDANSRGGGQRDPAAGVMLEDLLERYCAPSQPEERPELFRTTLIWRLPTTLIFCLRRFRFDSGDDRGEGEGGRKLETAVDIPLALDFSCGDSAPLCHHSRARHPSPDCSSKRSHVSVALNGSSHVESKNGMGLTGVSRHLFPSAQAEKGKHLLSLTNEGMGSPPREAAEKGKHLLALINGGVIPDGSPDAAVHSSNEASGVSENKPAVQPDSNWARRSLGNSCVYQTHVPSTNGRMWESPAAMECRDGGIYDLTGVCYHLGNSLESGHYVAAVKGPNDQWWECNDERCEPIETEKVTSGRWSILFVDTVF